jgi:hypothetical protein
MSPGEAVQALYQVIAVLTCARQRWESLRTSPDVTDFTKRAASVIESLEGVSLDRLSEERAEALVLMLSEYAQQLTRQLHGFDERKGRELLEALRHSG